MDFSSAHLSESELLSTFTLYAEDLGVAFIICFILLYKLAELDGISLKMKPWRM